MKAYTRLANISFADTVNTYKYFSLRIVSEPKVCCVFAALCSTVYHLNVQIPESIPTLYFKQMLVHINARQSKALAALQYCHHKEQVSLCSWISYSGSHSIYLFILINSTCKYVYRIIVMIFDIGYRIMYILCCKYSSFRLSPNIRIVFRRFLVRNLPISFQWDGISLINFLCISVGRCSSKCLQLCSDSNDLLSNRVKEGLKLGNIFVVVEF